MYPLRSFVALSVFLATPVAIAADASNGVRVAEARCVTCHAVGPLGLGRDVADAPPFEAIATKFAAQPKSLAFAIRDPHPRMNITVTPREAEDIAAYINTLAK